MRNVGRNKSPLLSKANFCNESIFGPGPREHIATKTHNLDAVPIYGRNVFCVAVCAIIKV